MTDESIIQMFMQRNENAIKETQAKYHDYCSSIAYNILKNNEDVEECVNDTYLALWNSIPPENPEYLKAYAGKITRNLSLKKLRASATVKRGGNSTTLSFEELENCLGEDQRFNDVLDSILISRALSDFLRTLPDHERRVFVCRYWYCDGIEDIAKRFGFGKSKVKMILFRTRGKLSQYLSEKGVFI